MFGYCKVHKMRAPNWVQMDKNGYKIDGSYCITFYFYERDAFRVHFQFPLPSTEYFNDFSLSSTSLQNQNTQTKKHSKPKTNPSASHHKNLVIVIHVSYVEASFLLF